MADMPSLFSRPFGPDIGGFTTDTSVGSLFEEAVEKRVGPGLRDRSRGPGLAGHPKSLDEADENSGGACRIDAGGQRALVFRARECGRELGLHRLEKPANTNFDFRIVTGQFQG